MEPFSALAIATATCQFLDFTSAIVSGTWKIYNSKSGLDSERNSHVRNITEDLIRLNGDIRNLMQHPSGTSLSAGDEAILKLGDKCDEVALRLVDALDRLQKKTQKRKAYEVWESFHVALRTVWDESSINALVHDLQSYRQQVTMQLLVSQRELAVSSGNEQKQFGRAQTRAIEDNTELSRVILAKMDKNYGDINLLAATIRQNYSQGAPGIMIATPASKVHEVLQNNDTTEAIKLVLHQLHFRELTHRYERVAVAHQRTFEWLFRTSDETDGWANFVDWLQSDTDLLYWVTGKPGAGKSTLMRFVLDHPETDAILDQWRGEKQLLKLSFFFWNSGTEMQMSYEGLARSLLYQILDRLPEMINVTFPHRVLDSLLFGNFLSDRQGWNWTWDELMLALRTLIRDCTKNYNIMIFIDGMDEFNGKSSALIEFVRRLIVPGVKICASSRPWNEFEDAFGHGPHLRIEKLTSQDMEEFVSSSLASSLAFSDYQESHPGFSMQIVHDICHKSEGVFLWVQLATNSLLEGLEGGESPSALQTRLDNLPADLEDLFDKILFGLDGWHSERCSQMFQIHQNSLRPLTLLDMSFAAGEDPNHAIEAAHEKMSKEQANAKCRLMHRHINACTKGLLEAGTREADDVAKVEVRLLHRTVKDYLERPLVWERICNMSSETVNINLRLYNCHLMRLKTDIWWDGSRDSGPEHEAELATTYAKRCRNLDTALHGRLLRSVDLGYAQCGSSQSWYLYEDRITTTTSLHVAIHCELFEYIEKGLGMISDDQDRVRAVTKLLQVALLDRERQPQSLLPHSKGFPPVARLVRFLLERGADPNCSPSAPTLTWFEFLLDNNKEHTSDFMAIIEEFIRFGADITNPFLHYFLKDTTSDTTKIKAILKQKRKELSWRQRTSYHVSHLKGKHLN